MAPATGSERTPQTIPENLAFGGRNILRSAFVLKGSDARGQIVTGLTPGCRARDVDFVSSNLPAS